MKYRILILILIGYFNPIFGQFSYLISSEPDSAKVFMNGKEVGNTPYHAKYYWKDKNQDKRIIFSVQAEGYETWSDTIQKKPQKFDKRATINLERKLPSFKFDSSSIFVAYDKLLAIFDNNEQIGTIHFLDGRKEPIKWDGTVKVGANSFEDKFYEIVSKSGIPTPITKHGVLFSEENSRKKVLPRYVIGGQIKEFNVIAREVKKTKASSGTIIYNTRITVEWKILDKATDKVVLTQASVGTIRLRDNGYNANVLKAFEDALIEFLNTGTLNDLLKNTKTDQVQPKKEETFNSSLVIKTIENPKFNSTSELVRYANQSYVTILTDAGHGSGVIIDGQGYIVTAYHVVNGVNKLKVRFENGIELDAQLISHDNPSDLALLKISGSGFRALPISKESGVSIGEEVLTIGTPADIDLGQSISRGMVSGKRSVENEIFLQLDISVSPGNSGGPLLNQQGEIIGVIQKKIIGTGVEGIGFAIPAKRIIEIFGLTFTE